MTMKELVLKNRSYRRFHEDVSVTLETLKELVDLARLSPSASNIQPLKFLLSCDAEKNALIFPHLAWAAYLKDWSGLVEGERPAAKIAKCALKARRSVMKRTLFGLLMDIDLRPERETSRGRSPRCP